MLLLFSLIPAAIGVISVIIVTMYPLSERKMKTIAKDLSAVRD